MVVHRPKRRSLEPGGRGDLERVVRVAMFGPKPPGEQLVVDAQPAVLLLGVGALDRQEAFDEDGLAPSPVPLPGASDIALRLDAWASDGKHARHREPSGPRAAPAAVPLVVRARLGVAQDGAR